jgi:hypothetical protein
VGQESFLLRMLEPAVRPDATSGPLSAMQRRAGGVDPEAPIETRSFDELLAQAQAPEAMTDPSPDEKSAASTASPLAALAQFNQIENDSLRRVLAQASAQAQPRA